MRKNLKIITFLPLLIICFLLIGCFSPWREDEGNFTVTVGSSTGGSRALWNDIEVDDLTHIIRLHNGPGPDQTRLIPAGTQTASFSVTPGRWTITVEAYLELNENLEGDLTARGEVTVNVKPGKNGAISIQMGLPPKEENFTVTFDLNYELNSGEEETIWDVVSVTNGEKVQRPATPPIRDDGLAFLDWFTDADCNNAFDFSTPITGDIILYAGWSSDTVNVVFNGMGGIFGEQGEGNYTIPIAKGGRVTAPTISWPGYILEDWYTEEGYTNVFDFETPITEDITLYAKWSEDLEKPLTITVTDDPEKTLSPIDKTATLTVKVSGFIEDTDANDVVLAEPIADPALTFDEYDTKGVAVSGTKTFTVKVTYDGEGPFPTGSTVFSFTIPSDSIPDGYSSTISGSGFTSINIADGKKDFGDDEPDLYRCIPVTAANIAKFNDYANTDGMARHYKLAENITLDTTPNGAWTPIGTDTNYFTGSFDGQSYSITGLVITQHNENYLGMFGSIGAGGVVKDLKLAECTINSTINNAISVGAVAGTNEGTVENCSVDGSVTNTSTGSTGGVVGVNEGTVTNCSSTVTVTASSTAGGVVGVNEGTVTNCDYYAPTSSGNSVEATGKAGGIVGHNNSIVENCHYTGGTVTASAEGDAGGVVGYNYNGTVTGCSSAGNVTVTNGNAGGVVGYNVDSDSKVEYCYATGNVQLTAATGTSTIRTVGGVVGDNEGTVQYCYYTPTQGNSVEATGTGKAGGVVGRNGKTDSQVKNCYATGNVESGNDAGGVVGQNFAGTVENCYATGNVETTSTSDYAGGVVGYVTNGTVRNSVALNKNIAVPSGSTNYGRVIGGALPAGTITSNYGRDDMQVNDTPNTSWGNPVSDKDGANVDTTALSPTWWETTPGVFSGSNAWDFSGAGLPVLQNMPEGTQTPTVP